MAASPLPSLCLSSPEHLSLTQLLGRVLRLLAFFMAMNGHLLNHIQSANCDKESCKMESNIDGYILPQSSFVCLNSEVETASCFAVAAMTQCLCISTSECPCKKSIGSHWFPHTLVLEERIRNEMRGGSRHTQVDLAESVKTAV